MKKFLLGFISGFVSAGLLILLFGYFISKKLDPGEFRPPELRIEEKLKAGSYDLQLMNLKDKSVADTLAWKGKVVLLNFWERWCLPCKKELKSLEHLYESTKDSALAFAVISTEEPELTAADSVVIKSGLPFYHLKNIIPEVYNGEGVPRTYILNKVGKLITKEGGARDWARESAVKLIDSLKKQ